MIFYFIFLIPILVSITGLIFLLSLRKDLKDVGNIFTRELHHLDGALACLDNMRKALRLEPKQPKTIKEFWDIFVKIKEILDDNHVEFDERIKDIKCDVKVNKTKLKNIEKKVDNPIKIIVVLTVISIGIAGGGLLFQKMQLDEALSENLISDVIAFENPIRVGDGELYNLTLHNYGELEWGLEITIKFNYTTKIGEMQYKEPTGEEGYSSINVLKNEYFVRFEKIYAGQDIDIRFDIDDEQLKNNNTLLIGAKSIKGYTESGKIIIFPGFLG